MHFMALAFAMWFLPVVSFITLVVFHITTSPMRKTIHDLQTQKRVLDARVDDVITERRSYE